jgi:hypothetical protein
MKVKFDSLDEQSSAGGLQASDGSAEKKMKKPRLRGA